MQLCPVILKNKEGILLQRVGFFPENCIRKFRLEIAEGFCFVVFKCHITDALRGGRDNYISERAFRETVIDCEASAAVFIFGRGHSFNIYEQVMQAAGTGKARFKSRVEKSNLVAAKHFFGMFEADVLQKSFRSRSCPLGKHSLKMSRAKMYFPGHLIEIGLCPEV